MAENDLFASVVSDIKSYTGKDPLMPWLRGIRRMRERLPPEILKEKLPRFLQKCAQAFQEDKRYRNDLRFLRVWLQLMDYAENPKCILRTMEMSHIGVKRALFYQAYALYYEKMKKYDEAEKMYMTGVQNLAEPLDELQKSYEQFIHRMERHMKKRLQRHQWRDDKIKALNKAANSEQIRDTKENNENTNEVKIQPPLDQPLSLMSINSSKDSSAEGKIEESSTSTGRNSNIPCSEDTVIVPFAAKATVGKSEAEDACHHGLVEPTINMKEAMDSINSMFREPLDSFVNGRKTRGKCMKVKDSRTDGLQVFVDESKGNSSKSMHPIQNDLKPFEIYVDDDESSEAEQGNQAHANQNILDRSATSDSSEIPFPIIISPPSDYSADGNNSNPSRGKFREDTVVFRFVGSTTVNEPEVVENVCHHGLVEPTVNMKEAMDDINNMFGKPMDFVRSRRLKKQGKAVQTKDNLSNMFSILPDDDPKTVTKENSPEFLIFQDEEQNPNKQIHSPGLLILPDVDSNSMEFLRPPKPSKSTRDVELFEPTVFTKAALDDINKMFGMPLDF